MFNEYEIEMNVKAKMKKLEDFIREQSYVQPQEKPLKKGSLFKRIFNQVTAKKDCQRLECGCTC
jgi:hypothetical protein